MSKVNFFYAKLSCPKTNDDNKFYTLIENLKKFTFFDFQLTNIPNNLENAKPDDLIFILVSGDSSNKRKYFKDNAEYREYENGLHAVGNIKKIDVEGKKVKVNIIGLKEVVTKEDLYFFPQFINNLGGSTKGSPNQAGLYELEEDIIFGLIDYINKRQLLSENNKIFSDFDFSGILYNKALECYKNEFKEKQLTQKVFKKYTNISEPKIKNVSSNKVVESFVDWFAKPENHKKSYKGLVNKENLLFWDRTYFHNELFKIFPNNKSAQVEHIKKTINNNENEDWIEFNNSTSKGAPKAVLGDKNYLKFLEEYLVDETLIPNIKVEELDVKLFKKACYDFGLKFEETLIPRFVASLTTKPFVLLTGLSGSGKTKLAQAFAKWICASEDQYALIPVGADWTNREPLLGYPNALKDNEYVKPDNKVLDLLIKANDDDKNPYFLILDEMNLSHVERYFADFLSTMESGDDIPLHDINKEVKDIKNSIKLPKNLFIIGTVNIDETTYMFSPKVLDRANTIEFRVKKKDIIDFLNEPKGIELEKLETEGAHMAESFVAMATNAKEDYTLKEEHVEEIKKFFEKLQNSGAEFGYRTAYEISKLIYKLGQFGMDKIDDRVDVAIMQKMLPKLHGSRTKLQRTLKPLARLCLNEVSDEDFENDYWNNLEKINFINDKNIKYKISFEKIIRMYKNAIENGFASYAEA